MSADTNSVAELAYELWVARGRPHGSALQDWAEAERQLAARGKAPPPPRNPLKMPSAAQGPGAATKAPKPRKTKKESNAPQARKRPGKSPGDG